VSAPAVAARFDVPWWGRAAIASAAGALVGVFTAWAGATATPAAKLLAIGPLVAAANFGLADVGRRALSPLAPSVAAIATLAAVACFQAPGAALATILVGGLAASRLVSQGRHRDTRRFLLFGVGAVACPTATFAAYRIVERAAPGEPLPMALALFHALFWLPVAGAEATLAWSAARARSRAGRRGTPSDGLDPDEMHLSESETLAALARDLARRIEEARAAAPADPGDASRGDRGAPRPAPDAAGPPEARGPNPLP